jgi:long-chain acyl-CoA synthetase|tara:strand:- start:211 stop:1704 length:1494 start_codon:yes stop_codon:yes gene_type:complete
MEDLVAKNLGNLLRHSLVKHTQRHALIGRIDDVTYKKLYLKVLEIAEKLIKHGSKPHDPILVLVSNQPSDIAAILGIWQAEGVIVPISRTSPKEVYLKIQKKTNAKLLIDYQSFDKEIKIVNLSSNQFSDLEIIRGAAFIIFTSGSTGEPKGVVVSHQAFIDKIYEIDKILQFNEQDRVLLVLNINFVFGLWLALLTLLRGGAIYIHEKFNAEEFISTLAKNEITRVGVVPTMMRVIFSKLELIDQIEKKVNTGCLKQILIGGESLGRSLAVTVRKEFSKTDLIDIYGSTETASCDFFSFPDTFSKYPGSIGKPSGGVTYRIVDLNNKPVRLGEEGELQIFSPYLMNGYLNEAELTQKSFSGKWFKTGDIVKEVGPLVLELMGRSKELISRGGNKISPGEIEQAICSHRSVIAAMAVGIADDILGERIHVLIIPNSLSKISVFEVKTHLKKCLEKYKIPDVFYFGIALPVGGTGKADRSYFKRQILSGELTPSSQQT